MPNVFLNLGIFSFIYLIPCIFCYLYIRSEDEIIKKNYFKVFLLASFLSFTFLYTLKNFSIGDDFHNYYKIMISLSSMPPEYSSNLFLQDYLFWSFLSIISNFTHNSYVFGLIFAFIFFIFVLISGIKFESKVIIFALLCILFSRPFLEAVFNPLRSSMALIFVYFSLFSFARKSFLPSILFYLIALNFHLSIAILFLLFLFFHIFNVRLLTIGFIFSFILFLLLNIYGERLPIIDLYNDYLAMEAGGVIEALSLPIFYLISLTPCLFLPILYLSYIDLEDEIDITYLKFLLVSASFIVITISINPIGLRLALILIPLSLLLFFKYILKLSERISFIYLSSLLIFNFLIIGQNIYEKNLYFDDEQIHYIDYEIVLKNYE